MIKKCPKCGYERQPKDDKFVSPAKCPRCGVIYAKAEASLLQKQDEEEALIDQQTDTIGEKESKTSQEKRHFTSLLKWASLCAIIFLLFIFVRANSQSQKAYLALKRIEALTQSGVNFADYSNAVSAAKLEINLMKKNSKDAYLKSAFHEYQEAKNLWSNKIKGNDKAVTVSIFWLETVGTCLEGNKLMGLKEPEASFDYYKDYAELNYKIALNYYWNKASKKLNY